MTRRTAEALIRRLDVNRTLAAAGRNPEQADLDELRDLVQRARDEDREVPRG